MSAARRARRAAKPKHRPHRFAKCRDCRRVSAAIGYGSCDLERLCDQIDVSLVATLRGRSIEELRELGQLVETGQLSVPSAFAARLFDVTTGEQFVRFVVDVHRHIFAGVFDFAGELRSHGESAAIDEENHTVICLPGGPSIAEALAELHLRVGLISHRFGGAVPPDEFARWAARFLERFFAIHPFADGNGRTARAIVDLVARGTINLRVRAAGRGGAERRHYVSVLRYAHKHRGRTEAGRLVEHRDPDPLRHLERWCFEHLDERDEPGPEEIPEWWDLDEPDEESPGVDDDGE